MIAYINGQYLPKDEIRISPDDRGFLFADGAYDVIRCYEGKLFQAEAHIRRLARSISELRIECSAIDTLQQVAEELIQQNHLTSGQAIVYFQITRGAAPRTHRFPSPPVPATVYAFAARFQPHQKELDNGTRIILVSDTRWARCDIKSISLLPNILAHQQAIDGGATEAVFVRDGAITEGAHTNVCAVVDGTLITAPKSNYILAGITREIVLDLCRQLGIPVLEFPILDSQLKAAAEVMLVGTTVEITPVVQVDHWPVANGQPGPITRRLQQAFYELIQQSH
ncbi:MAG: D-amino-acid transaminase [candidate division KSB1 bacterium]|nr:D-amino-acid transaminase [candidate division KSB1 bacterium]MDZ7342629.1 D-amino-acid transaminase [candidate division KSB1 bacterium]